MEMFISIIVLIVAPFGLLLALQPDVALEAERANTFFSFSRNRASSGR